jgi:hypothetical protein
LRRRSHSLGTEPALSGMRCFVCSPAFSLVRRIFVDGGGSSATALVVALAKLARDGYLDLTGCDQTDIGAVHAALGAWIEARRTHIFGTKARPNRVVSLRRRADELDEAQRSSL